MLSALALAGLLGTGGVTPRPAAGAGATDGPPVGPEVRVADPAMAPGVPGYQLYPTAAFDGENYLVVWGDDRAAHEGDVYGARVTPDGTVLDPTGIPISTAPGWQQNVKIAFDGTNFLVVWSSGRDLAQKDIRAARVNREGVVLDPDGILVATGPNEQAYPAVAFDGTNHLVTWIDQLGRFNEIHGARVTPAGAVLDRPPIRISPDAYGWLGPNVAFDGSNHVVVWAEPGTTAPQVVAARVGRDGTVLDPDGITIAPMPSAQTVPAVASDGSNSLVVWSEERAGTPSTTYGARLTPAGEVLDPEGIRLSASGGFEHFPSVAFGGGNYLVSWDDWREGAAISVRGTRVSPAGEVLDPAGIPVHAPPESSAYGSGVAYAGGDYAVFAGTHRIDGTDIDMVTVSTDGTVDPRTVSVSNAANAQMDPAIALGGGQYLVVWVDNRSGTADVYGARVSPSGMRLDGTGIPIATGAGAQTTPSVAFDGTNFLVVWTDDRAGAAEIRGGRISPTGAVLDPGGFVIDDVRTHLLSDPNLAFDGRNHLVVWLRSVGYERNTYVTRVSTTGSVLDEPVLALEGDNVPTPPAVAFDGTNHLVVSYNQFFAAGVAALVDRDGEVVGTFTVFDGAPFAEVEVDVAFDGTNHLVVWEDERSGNDDISGARVRPDGTVLDPAGIPISTGEHRELEPSVAANGDFLVTWHGDHKGDGSRDVYGARVTGDGEVVDVGGFPVAKGPSSEWSSDVVAGPGDRFSVSYQRFVPEPSVASQRAVVRLVAPN